MTFLNGCTYMDMLLATNRLWCNCCDVSEASLSYQSSKKHQTCSIACLKLFILRAVDKMIVLLMFGLLSHIYIEKNWFTEKQW